MPSKKICQSQPSYNHSSIEYTDDKKPIQKIYVFSEHKQLYQKIIGNLSNYKRQQTKQISKSKIFTFQNKFFKNIQIFTIDTDFESIRIFLYYGNYKMEITVIFTKLQQSFFPQETFGEGSFGSIYTLKANKQKIAIKKIPIPENQIGLGFSLKQIYKQYFLYMFASQIGFGPLMIPIFGYDIIITKNAAFFSMEMCQPIKSQNLIQIQRQMKQNMLKMHSLKMVHLDIKPQNMAFSKQQKRYVFLDFGLSKLIQQEFGQKSHTRFSGTVPFCSQEMKRCYILQQKFYVDLYYNDLCGLQLTIRKLHYMKQGINQFTNLTKYENKYQNNLIKSQVSLLQDSINVFQLKYNIFRNNKEKIIKSLNKICNKMPNCSYQLINKQKYKQNINNITKDINQMNNLLDCAKKYLFKSKSFDSDKYLCSALCSNHNKFEKFSKILPIYEIVSISNQNLNKYLQNVDEINKIYIFINPFTYENEVNLNNYDNDNIRKKLINKIFQSKIKNKQNDILKCEKIRLVLLYFYENLRQFKNIKILSSLRLLFICIKQQFDLISQIQLQILQLTSDLNIRMFQLIQFEIFSNLTMMKYGQITKQKRSKILKDIKIDENSLISQKLKEIASLIYNIQHIRAFKQKYVHKIQNYLIQIQKLDTQSLYSQYIEIIKYLFYVFVQKINGKGVIKIPNILTLKIYTINFQSFNSYLFQKDLQKIQNVLKLFPSMTYQFDLIHKNQNLTLIIPKFMKYTFNSNHISRYFNMFQIMFKCYLLNYKLQKQFILNYSQKIINFISNDQKIYQHKLLLYLICIFNLQDLLSLNKNQQTPQNQLSEIQKCKIYDDIRSIYIFVQKQKKHFNKNKESFVILNKSLQLYFQKQINYKTVQNSLIQTTQNINQQFQTKPSNLLQLFSDLQTKFSVSERKKIEDIFVNIYNYCINETDFFAYQFIVYILRFLIQIKNQRGDFQYSFEAILKFIKKINKKNCIFDKNIFCEILTKIISQFIDNSPIQFLKDKYFKLQQNKLQFLYGGYTYFLFSIFIKIYQNLSSNIKIKQLKQTCLLLDKMDYVTCIYIRHFIYEIARKQNIYRNRRKMIICIKREFNCQHQRKLNIYINIVKSQLKIRIKSQKIILPIMSKIKKLQTNILLQNYAHQSVASFLKGYLIYNQYTI